MVLSGNVSQANRETPAESKTHSQSILWEGCSCEMISRTQSHRSFINVCKKLDFTHRS